MHEVSSLVSSTPITRAITGWVGSYGELMAKAEAEAKADTDAEAPPLLPIPLPMVINPPMEPSRAELLSAAGSRSGGAIDAGADAGVDADADAPEPIASGEAVKSLWNRRGGDGSCCCAPDSELGCAGGAGCGLRTTAKLWVDASTWGGAIAIVCVSAGVGDAGTVGSTLPPNPALAPFPVVGPSSNSVSDTMRGVVDLEPLDFARERERESCRRVTLAPIASSWPEAGGAGPAAGSAAGSAAPAAWISIEACRSCSTHAPNPVPSTTESTDFRICSASRSDRSLFGAGWSVGGM